MGQAHQILIIAFWQSEFFEVILEDDNGSSLAAAFRDACETLQPKVAFIALHLHEATSEYVLDAERWLLNGEADRFESEGLGLVYFGTGVDDLGIFRELRQKHDYLTASIGRLTFAGSGKSRWFGESR
jgi:hypothetical protein